MFPYQFCVCVQSVNKWDNKRSNEAQTSWFCCNVFNQVLGGKKETIKHKKVTTVVRASIGGSFGSTPVLELRLVLQEERR